ncbi:MAG: Fe-S-containing protein [Bifidobacteriaceae bacterium]|nr:Fe-S-containing protein [Bifidobacteriaceae bacterium]
MLGQLIAVIQGCVPAAIILAVTLITGQALRTTTTQTRTVSAKNSGQGGSQVALRPAAWGSGAGATAGAALAILRHNAVITSREMISAWTAGLLIAALITCVVLTWMIRPNPNQTGALTSRFNRAGRTASGNWQVPVNQPKPTPRWITTAWSWAAAVACGLALLRALPTVFLQFSGFVVPGQPIWSTDSALRACGFILGGGLVAVGTWALIRASDAVPARLARPLFSVTAALTALSCAINLAQVLNARRLIDLPRGLFRILVWLANHQTGLLAVTGAAALILPISLLAANSRRAVTGPNPAVQRRIKAAKRRQSRYSLATGGAYAALGLALTVGVAVDQQEVELSPPEPYEFIGAAAAIPLELLEDGHLHRFAYTTTDGTEVRFIVIKKNGVAYGVGLDACEVCGPTGYYERDGKIICRLCDVIMNIATIGFKGGCNPIPLEHNLDGGYLLIATADLEAASPVFA